MIVLDEETHARRQSVHPEALVGIACLVWHEGVTIDRDRHTVNGALRRATQSTSRVRQMHVRDRSEGIEHHIRHACQSLRMSTGGGICIAVVQMACGPHPAIMPGGFGIIIQYRTSRRG